MFVAWVKVEKMDSWEEMVEKRDGREEGWLGRGMAGAGKKDDWDEG